MITAEAIPWDACICEGRVTRPRGNCWATTHQLAAATQPVTAQLDTMLEISEAAARAMLAQGGTEEQALRYGADQALAWWRGSAE